jgi:hypothetical protein
MNKVKATTPAQGRSANRPKRTRESDDTADDDTLTTPSKSARKSKVKKAVKADGVNLLGEFEERVHWAEQLEVWRMKEPARGQMTERNLLVAQVMTAIPKGMKFAGFDLGTLEGFAGFFEAEFATGRIGMATIPSSTTHGVKFLLDLTGVDANTLVRMPKVAIKLSKGLGLWLRRFGDPSSQVVLGGSYPTWMRETQLLKALDQLSWVKKVSEIKRATANVGLVMVDRCTVSVTPSMGQTIHSIVLNGTSFDDQEGANVEELLGSEKVQLTICVSGTKVILRRAPCCGYCGWDNHIQLDCEYHQRFTSDVGPAFRSRSLPDQEAVKASPVETSAALVKPVARVKKEGKGGKGLKKGGRSKKPAPVVEDA